MGVELTTRATSRERACTITRRSTTTARHLPFRSYRAGIHDRHNDCRTRGRRGNVLRPPFAVRPRRLRLREPTMSRPAEPQDPRHAATLDEATAALFCLRLYSAKLSATQTKLWCAVACGMTDVSLIAARLGRHRNTVSRALSALRSRGLIRRSPDQARHRGKYRAFFAYEALDERGRPFGR